LPWLLAVSFARRLIRCRLGLFSLCQQIDRRPLALENGPDDRGQQHGCDDPGNDPVGKHDDRRGQQADRIDHFDHRVERRTRGILQRIANRISHDARFMAFGAFTGIGRHVARFVFDAFLGIIPGAARVRHEHRQHLTAEDHARQETAQRFDLQYQPHD